MRFAFALLSLLAASATIAQRPASVERGSAAFIDAVNRAGSAATIPKVRPKSTTDLDIAHAPSNVLRHWVSLERARPKMIETAKQQVAAAQKEYTIAARGIVNPRYKSTIRGPRNVVIYPSADMKARTINAKRTLRDAAEERLSKAESGYTMPHFDSTRLPDDGDAGELEKFTIRQVIDDKNLLVEMHPRGRDVVFWIANVDTSGLTDGRSTGFRGVFACTGTRRYPNVAGSTRTVLVLEPVDEGRVIEWQRHYEKRD